MVITLSGGYLMTIGSIAKRLLLVAFGLLVGAIMLEIGLRVWLTQNGTLDQKVKYLYSRDEINRMATRYEGVAYLNYRLSTAYPEQNSLGYRGPEITLPKPDGVFRVVALGGSSTYGEFIKQWERTYPAQLERILHEEYGYTNVEVVNAGVPGYTSWESTVNFIFHVLDLDPDLIIVYHAVNDINPRLTDPDFYDGLYVGHGYWVDSDEALPVSSLYRVIAVRLFDWAPTVTKGLDQQFATPVGYHTCGLVMQGDQPYCTNLDMTAEAVLAANPPIYFERNIRNIVTLAQANGVGVLLSSWAYSPHEFDRPGGDFLAIPFRQDAIAEHNAIVQQIADDYQVPFYDLAAVLSPDPAYWVDGMHVNARGAEEQARYYAAFMVEENLLPAP
jgi:lysophospholipase L1-like esterase